MIQHFREILDDCRISVTKVNDDEVSSDKHSESSERQPYWQWVERNVEDAHILLGYKNPSHPYRIGIMASVNGNLKFFSVNPRVLRTNNGSDFCYAMKACYDLAAKHLKKFSWFRDLREVKCRKGRKRRRAEEAETRRDLEDGKHLQKDAFGDLVNPAVW